MVDTLIDRRRQLDALTIRHRAAEERVRSEREQLRSARRHLKTVERTQVIVQEIAQQVQATAHARIAEVVSLCLAAVWGDLYRLDIQFEKKRGRTEARLRFLRKDGLMIDPLDEASGGVVDVAAFALRLASIVMSRPQRRRLVVLDEPFKNVRGEEYQERVRAMVEQVSAELDFQIILNTDLAAIQTGTIIQLR